MARSDREGTGSDGNAGGSEAGEVTGEAQPASDAARASATATRWAENPITDPSCPVRDNPRARHHPIADRGDLWHLKLSTLLPHFLCQNRERAPLVDEDGERSEVSGGG